MFDKDGLFFQDGDIDLEEGADLLKDGGKGDGDKGAAGGSGGGLRSLISRFPALPSLSALPSVRLTIPPFVRRFKVRHHLQFQPPPSSLQ